MRPVYADSRGFSSTPRFNLSLTPRFSGVLAQAKRLQPFQRFHNSTPLAKSGSVATFTTPLPHGLEAGQGIVISGAGAPYDGGFSIKAIPSPNTFSYQLASSPSDNGGPPASTWTPWQTGRQILQGNIIELILSPFKSGWGFSEAIILGSGTQRPPYFFPEAVIRGNISRSLDGAWDPTTTVFGLFVRSCEKGVVEGNIVRLSNPTPIFFDYCGRVNFFNNQAPDGTLFPGLLFGTLQASNELTTDSQFALCLSTTK